MKNKIYYLGLSVCIITTYGCLSKLMHWPGAGIMLTFGLVILSVLFLPLALTSSFKEEPNKKLGTLYVLTAIILALNFISVLFKIMHWPQSNLLVIICLPLPFVVLLPVYLLSNSNDKEINYKNFMAVLFFFAYLAAISALLSSGPSRNVIDGYINSANCLEDKTNVLTENIQYIVSEQTKDTLSGKNSAIQNMKIVEESDRICIKIDDLRKILITNSSEDVTQVYNNSGIPNLSKIKNKDNRPNIDIHLISDLKNEINNYKVLLQREYITESEKNNFINVVLNTDKPNSNEASWEENLINNKVLVSVIESLNYLKYRIRLVEFEAISTTD
jgi:hypothetical protein